MTKLICFMLAIALLCLSGCGEFLKNPFKHQHNPTPPAVVYDANQTSPAPQPPPPTTKMWVGDSYVALGAWANWFPGSVNEGCAGNTVNMVLARVQAMPSVPPTVYVWCGINDLQVSPSRAFTLASYDLLIKALKARGATRIICMSPLPLAQVFLYYHGPDFTPPVVDYLDNQLQSIALSNGVEWLDLRSAVADPNGWCLPEYSMPGGIHLNAQGYDRVVTLLMSNPG